MVNKFLKRDSHLLYFLSLAIVDFVVSMIAIILALFWAHELGDHKVILISLASTAGAVHIFISIVGIVEYFKAAQNKEIEKKESAQLAYKLNIYLWLTPIAFLYCYYAYRKSGPSHAVLQQSIAKYKTKRAFVSLNDKFNKDLLSKKPEAKKRIYEVIKLCDDKIITTIERNSYIYDTLVAAGGKIIDPDLLNDEVAIHEVYGIIMKNL